MKAVRHLVLTGMLVCAACVAHAQTSIDVTLDSYFYDGSIWEYDYNITNSGDSGEYAFFFALDGIDGASIVHYPTGWDDIDWSASYDGWASWEATATDYWLAPGNSLLGFTIQSPFAPDSGRAAWTAYTNTDAGGGGTIYDYGGGITGPSNPGGNAVPEPASMAVTLLVLGIAGGVARRRRNGAEEPEQ